MNKNIENALTVLIIAGAILLAVAIIICPVTIIAEGIIALASDPALLSEKTAMVGMNSLIGTLFSVLVSIAILHIRTVEKFSDLETRRDKVLSTVSMGLISVSAVIVLVLTIIIVLNCPGEGNGIIIPNCSLFGVSAIILGSLSLVLTTCSAIFCISR